MTTSASTSASVRAPAAPGAVAPLMARWPRTRTAAAVRAVLRAITLAPLVRCFCARRRVTGAGRIPGGPVVFVANHASHADTALILRALPRRHRGRVAPAAAADYFFANRFTGALTSLVIGAFPFPRRGRAGLDRAHALLRRGWSVLLFPEGTRTIDGSIQGFKPGAAILAARAGVPIVPVGLAGTGEVLGKKQRLPRRAPVAVVFGEPITVGPDAAIDATTDRAEASVRAAAAQAADNRRAPRRAWHARVRSFANGRAALVFAFAWGAAEALAWPVVPDLAVATLVLAAPRRILPIAGAAVAGSLAGGLVAYAAGALGGAAVLDHVPLVTARMQAEAFHRMSAGAGAGILTQPWSGIPFKVFAYQAHDAGVGLAGFTWSSLLARGSRLLEVAAMFAAIAVVLRRWLARLYPWTVVAYTTLFFAGLLRVVASWS